MMLFLVVAGAAALVWALASLVAAVVVGRTLSRRSAALLPVEPATYAGVSLPRAS